MIVRFFRLAVCSLFVAIPVFAHAASIIGTVTDEVNNSPLPGVRIAVVGKHMGAVSGLDGSYKISDLAPGNYSLSISYPGYRDTTISVEVASEDAWDTLNIALRQFTMSGGHEVTVTGKTEHGSDVSTLERMRTSENVINAISARTIEISPDISVADASQRLSGVTMTRTAATGDAQYAIIRGMDKRYNYTTVNGIKIPSPDNVNQYVPLDIFPSSLLDRLEVSKTLTPSMEGDATGGVMNLVMKQAPDHEVLSMEAGSGYNDIFGTGQKFYTFTPDNAESPRIARGTSYEATMADFPASTWDPRAISVSPAANFSATYGNRFGDDQKLGLILSGSFQNTYRGANTLFFQSDINQIAGTPSLTEFENRTYSTFQRRWGAMTNIDYRADENNTFQIFGMYASLNKQEERNMYDTVNEKGSWPLNPEVDWTIRTENQTQGIANVTLSGNNALLGKDLSADWHIAYSRATLNDPDEAHLSLLGGVNYTSNPPNIQPYRVDDSKRYWESSTDEDKSVYLNLRSIEDVLGTTAELTYGGMFRNKTRNANYDEYELRVQNGQQYYNGNISLDTFSVYTPFGTAANPLDYNGHENVTAAFLQAKFPIGNLIVLGGARMEQTDFGWTSSEPASLPGKTGDITYVDLLPSLSLKYSPTENQNWRASYFKSISRPTFYEVIPSLGVPGDDYTEVSNDSLQRTQIDNLDLRWEYFPGALDQLLVGAFYKRLHDPIEWVIEDIQVNSIYQPQNLGDATNYGFEIDFRKFFSNFGISGNYTYTKSAITSAKVQTHYVNGTGVVFDTVSQTRPLEGQADHIGNLSLLYKNFETGTDAQISAVYTGNAIVAVSTYLNNDVWQKPFLQFDLSGEQRLWGNLSLYLKVTNLLNTPREEVLHEPYENSDYQQPIANQVNGQDILIRKELYDRTYFLGVRFKM